MSGLRNFDKKMRASYAAGNVFLLTAACMTLFLSTWGAHHRVLFEGVRGTCLALAIVLLLWVLARKRRKREASNG